MTSEHFPLRTPNIDSDGMVAFHDQACPVFYHEQKAVYGCNNGLFQPSWKAQKEGWIMVRCKTKFQRWLLKAFFGITPSRKTFDSLNQTGN